MSKSRLKRISAFKSNPPYPFSDDLPHRFQPDLFTFFFSRIDGGGQAFFVDFAGDGLFVAAFRGFDDSERQYADVVAVRLHEIAAVRAGITPNMIADGGLFQEFADYYKTRFKY